jgi:hypothetical protein
MGNSGADTERVGLIAAGLTYLALKSCGGPDTYLDTDKIDFVNRKIVEPLPTAAVATAVRNDGLVEEVGVLIDGRLGPSGPHVNDAAFTTYANRLAIPNRIGPSFGDFFIRTGAGKCSPSHAIGA